MNLGRRSPPPFLPPNPFEQKFAGQHPPGVGRQLGQQPVPPVAPMSWTHTGICRGLYSSGGVGKIIEGRVQSVLWCLGDNHTRCPPALRGLRAPSKRFPK